MFHSSITFLPTKRFNENNTKINTPLINFIKLQIKLEINYRKEKRWLTMGKLEKGEGIGGVVVVRSTKMAEEGPRGAAALASQQLAAVGQGKRSCCCCQEGGVGPALLVAVVGKGKRSRLLCAVSGAASLHSYCYYYVYLFLFIYLFNLDTFCCEAQLRDSPLCTHTY